MRFSGRSVAGIRQSRLSQLGCQVDEVCSLVNKMTINNQIHVVGEGIVGRAAFTGTHLWILQGNCIGEGHPSEVLAEVHHQFLAGMQTIAVIPVLPHGVVQLGSTNVIMEDVGFVNSVKSLFLQIDGVPGSLLSDNYTKHEPSQDIGAVTSLGTHLSAESDANSSSKIEEFMQLIGDNYNNQQIPIFQASRLVGQSTHSLNTQAQENLQANTLSSQTPHNMTPAMTKPHSDLFRTNVLPASKVDLPLRSQADARATSAQVILSNQDAMLNQQSSAYNSRSGFNQKPIGDQSGVTSNGLALIEQQILSDGGLLEPENNGLSVPHGMDARLGSDRAVVLNSLKDSVLASLLGGCELPKAGNVLQTLISVPCRLAESNSSRPPQEGNRPQFVNSSNSRVVSVPSQANLSHSSGVLPSSSHHYHLTSDDEHNKTEFPAGQQGVDLFQALHLPSVHLENFSRCRPMPGFIDDCSTSGQKHDTGNSISQSVVCEDTCVLPALGEDLFDILGLDFKSKQAYGSWNDGPNSNRQSFNTDASTCTTQLDARSNFYSMNDGILESGIFSESGADHLLDAVVSKVHSSAKQNSDDNASCRTTLTKISSSSVPTESFTYSRVDQSDQRKVEMFGVPPPPSKPEIVGSSSFKSGCSKDNAGDSQVNSFYRSPMSLWVEDGNNLKRENSFSNAHSKRPDEVGKPNRKRLRPGESPRPRPKDRQMIQDRVKELREIVPNGSKCSIDALLERTIKHMLFLQSVTKHADKLKQTGESKIINKEGGLLLKDNFEGGATWAFEVGSHSMICPIIVEDLNPPRQMLVENGDCFWRLLI
uniref:BHLH domain-containing protein n=1 Tax=Nelumbo nucifera TaxID=4432 RepID=A0A822Y4U0_NELNU|nr:TPA_asm: hypothetical protein HUJ06_030422 [Nelumbo nucifera]